MTTINYYGMELEEVTIPQIFDPPRNCLVWDENPRPYCTLSVSAIARTKHGLRILSDEGTTWRHCAILPDPPKSRRATNRELSRWLAQGNGEISGDTKEYTIAGYYYTIGDENAPVKNEISVRKWSDTEWHEPTVDYLGIDDDDYNFHKKYGEV